MSLDKFAGKPLGGLPDSLRWVMDLEKRMAPVIKMQQRFDDIMRLNRLAELVALPCWTDGAFWEASRKLDAVARSVAFPPSLAASAAVVARFEALALRFPPDIGRQVAGLGGQQAAFFQNWAALVEVARPAWLPQLEALQLRLETVLVEVTEAEEPQAAEVVASASASVLDAGREIVDTQQVSSQRLTSIEAALLQLTELQQKQTVALEKQLAAQQITNLLLAKIQQEVTESRSKKLQNLVNTLVGILSLLLGLLAYLEAKKQEIPLSASSVKQSVEKPVSIQMVQAMLLPHVLTLLQQRGPARVVAHRVKLQEYPRRQSTTVKWLLPGEVLKPLYTRGRWACVLYIENDDLPQQRWVLKKYLQE
jgi:hypothetical protein